ncbi:hypothetical protein AZF37_05010 [endosymbiont 'TC1' of Trimyema compressum]|uniref:protein translocase subunit SecD n=1 Tax=endosymbiont 'TC1' of Trimyema compressum TaxID=243899 RepID=UPI0007F0AC5C|nr:protein translocase subunit SecD [endosymbiont 'TC1' of Trimyema compressum]AMP20618.1 hypothetical protein AZF37_05010 [endosymbiont 'TC1' of Trimyema compressum]
MKIRKRSLLLLALICVSILIIAGISYTPLRDNLQLGLDLRGGVHVMLEAQEKDGQPVTADDMAKLQEIMRKRVDTLGVSEPIIQVVGNNRLIVEIAGINDPDAAINLIGKTAELKFIAGDVKTNDGANIIPILTGADLQKAYAAKSNNTNKYSVVLEFNETGKAAFAEATGRLSTKCPEGDPRRKIAILLDNELITNPNVKEAITDGQATISGGFASFDEANNIAKLLNSGALPVGLQIVEKSTIGPTLGAESLNKSLIAVGVGLALLALFLILLYRLPGVVTTFSLIAFTNLLLAVMVMIKATLTLPGIAALILTIAIAADANIILICRIQDELRSGKSLQAAINGGYKKAFITILDTNITTMLAGVIILVIGSGSIQGFAVILLIGITINLITSLMLSRIMLQLAVKVKFFQKKSFYGFRISPKEKEEN